MHILVRIILLLSALGLTACGGAPQVASSSPAPSAATAAPTAAPTASLSPTPSVIIVPTVATTSTASATSTTVATASATATATTTTAAASPTVTATATTAAPSATATAETVQATATTASTADPGGGTTQPRLSGTIAFERGGSVYGYRVETEAVGLLIEGGRDVQFSRDGAQLAFVRDDGLYLAAADGSAARRIVEQTNISAPRWADDSSKLLFERRLAGPAPGFSEIWTVELPQGAPLKIAEGNDPAWAPDSKRIAYVTPGPNLDTGGPRRNELHLTNWRGQNDWPVVRQLPTNTPATGIPGSEVAPAQLEHLLYAPIWSYDGGSIYVLARATMQVETDFILFERADAVNGGSTYQETVVDVQDAIVAPDRRGLVFSQATQRGDIGLIGRALDTGLSGDAYDWADARSLREPIFQHFAPTWSPDSSALATIRCDSAPEQRCDLVLLAPGQEQPRVLVADLLQGAALDYTALPTMSWGR